MALVSSLFAPAQTAHHAEQAAVEQAALEQAFAPAAQDQPKDTLRVPRWLALLGSNLFDAGTTQAALSRGAVESNPLLRGVAGNPAALYGLKGGIGALEAMLMDLVAKKGHHKVANTVGFGLSGMNTAIGAHNLTRGR